MKTISIFGCNFGQGWKAKRENRGVYSFPNTGMVLSFSLEIGNLSFYLISFDTNNITTKSIPLGGASKWINQHH